MNNIILKAYSKHIETNLFANFQDLKETCWESYKFAVFTFSNSVFIPVKNFHFSWFSCIIPEFLNSFSKRRDLDLCWAFYRSYDLDFLRVSAKD